MKKGLIFKTVAPSAFSLFTKMFFYSLSILAHTQLRYLQTLNSISAEKNSTIVFPVPIDIISKLMGVRSASANAHAAPAQQLPQQTPVSKQDMPE